MTVPIGTVPRGEQKKMSQKDLSERGYLLGYEKIQENFRGVSTGKTINSEGFRDVSGVFAGVSEDLRGLQEVSEVSDSSKKFSKALHGVSGNFKRVSGGCLVAQGDLRRFKRIPRGF